MLRSFLMTYLDLITQQAGSTTAFYFNGEYPGDTGVSINGEAPKAWGSIITHPDGLEEGSSWYAETGGAAWGTTSSPQFQASYSGWVYFPTGSAATSVYFSARSNSSFQTSGAVGLYPPSDARPGGAILVGSSVINDVGLEFDKWHHFAVVEGVGYFVDGVKFTQIPLTSTSYRRIRMGAYGAPLTSVPPNHPRYDHFAFIGRQLTDAEIQEQANYPGFQPFDEVEEAPEPATADAEMLDAEFSNIGHAKINAAPMHAEARSGYHEVFGDRTAYTRRVLAPTVWRYNKSWGTTTGPLVAYSGEGSDFVIRVPDGRIDPTDILSSKTLTLGKISGGNAPYNSVKAWRSNSQQGEGTSLPVTNTAGLITMTVPHDVEYIKLRIATYTESSWDNPVNDVTSDASYFTISAEPAPVTRVPAPTAHASALAIDPALDITANILRYVPATVVSAEAFTPGVSVQTAADIAMQTTPANAEGFMPNPTMPNVGVYPDAALGTAAMNATWFSSEVRVNVAYAEAEGEALDIEGVTADRNIILGVAAATARATIREPWLSINDVEVDRNAFDPYWNRVARRSTEGYLPPSADWWYRLNQREGDFVQRLNQTGVFVTRPPSGYVNGYTIEGDFEWGAAGPNGKRGMAVREAVFGNADYTYHYEHESGQQSLEFTVRLDPGHTGRMEVARGQSRWGYSGYPGGERGFYVSIRDGKVYFYGHSFSRIDDGEWHHVVVTTTRETVQDYHGQGFIGKTQINRAIYIDGKLDRFLTSVDNTGGIQGFSPMARPTRFLGGDTDYPFKGEILDIVTRQAPLLSHEVQELYLDMFGHKAIRAGSAMAVAADMGQKSKVVSNMKRMLVVSWMTPDDRQGVSAFNDDGHWIRTIPTKNGQLSPMLGYGWDEDMDVGRYLMTTVYADRIWTSKESPEGPLKPGLLSRNTAGMYIDPVSGRKRWLNLVEDVDLELFDVITFQAYPNAMPKDMWERQMHEAFYDSVNEALAQGHKFWLTDAYLAADLGWVSRVETVPFMGRPDTKGGFTAWPHPNRANDVRGYENAPWLGLSGHKKPVPEDGSMPKLPGGIPQGSQSGIYNLWSIDVHHNNGYRVVNEIEGLTDIPSFEVVDAYARDRTTMIVQSIEDARHFGYRLENRTGEDFMWDENEDGTWKNVKVSKGKGLKVGDEFYDYKTLRLADVPPGVGGGNMQTESALRNRVYQTWAIPPGHLRIGTPVATFRRTIQDDYGREAQNPWRDYIRNAVVRPGDRLPDGRKVQGYAFIEFSEHPVGYEMAGISVPKQLPPGVATTVVPNEPVNYVGAHPENPYSIDWDWATYGRQSYSGGGNVRSVQVKFYYGPRVGSGGNTSVGNKGEKIEWLLPMAGTTTNLHPTVGVPHQTWNSRGISWLTLVDSEDTEVALSYQDAPMAATAEMLSPHVEADFDNTVSVGAAQANGRIVDPGETVIKATTVVAYAATARGTMMGLQGGYKAEAATSFGDMYQNVRRPLDVQEVLFFTIAFTQEPIYVRMEEN